MEKELNINKISLPLNTSVNGYCGGYRLTAILRFLKFSFKSRGWDKNAEKKDDGQITLLKFCLFQGNEMC